MKQCILTFEALATLCCCVYFVWFPHWIKIYLPLLHLCIFFTVYPWHLVQCLIPARSSINTCWMNEWLGKRLHCQPSPVSSGPGQALGITEPHTPLLCLPSPHHRAPTIWALACLDTLYSTPDSLGVGLTLSPSQRLEPWHPHLDQVAKLHSLLLCYRVRSLASVSSAFPDPWVFSSHLDSPLVSSAARLVCCGGFLLSLRFFLLFHGWCVSAGFMPLPILE